MSGCVTGLARLADGIGAAEFAQHLLAPPYRTFPLPGTADDRPAPIRLGVGGGDGTDLETGLSRVAHLLSAWNRGRRAISP